MFESTALVADRWTPAVDPGCEEDYSDLDLAQWVADRWACEAAGLDEAPYAHGCNQACDDGCTDPYVPQPAAAAGDRTAAEDAVPPRLPAGTALITDAVACRPPAELAAFLAGVPDLAGLDGWSVVEVMKGYEKVARWAAAGQLAAVAEIARRYPDPQAGWARDATAADRAGRAARPHRRRAVTGPTFDQATAQVAYALDLPRASAQGLLVDAVALADRVPAVRDRLAAGTISARVARVIAQETMVCADPATAARVAEHVLAQPGVRTGPQARSAAGAAVIAADPAAAHRREQNAHAGRSFRPVKDTTDGMTTWDVCLPVASSLAIDRRLTRLAGAARTPADPRTRAAVRADIATALLLGQPVTTADGTVLTPANLPTPTTWRTDVVVAASTLEGGDQPGQVPGWGPVTAPTARRLATGLPHPASTQPGPASRHRARHARAHPAPRAAVHPGRRPRMAPPAHRPRHRHRPGLRHHPLPAPHRPGRLRQGPRPALLRARLHHPGSRLRPGPHPQLPRRPLTPPRPRRRHRRLEPRRRLPHRPPHQSHARLERHQPHPRHLHLAHPHRPHLHPTPRTTHPPGPSGTARTIQLPADRHLRPTALLSAARDDVDRCQGREPAEAVQPHSRDRSTATSGYSSGGP